MSTLVIDDVVYKYKYKHPGINRIYGYDAILHIQELYNTGIRIPVSYNELEWAAVVFIKAINITLMNNDSFVDVELIKGPS